MASKASILCIIAFLLLSSSTFTYAARSEPIFTDVTPMDTQHGEVDSEKVQMGDSCQGLGEEECLMRRTLEAHIDYIYTQKHNP